jgi:carboxyvinyl-carboxyphosphonate phosphorylmutase
MPLLLGGAPPELADRAYLAAQGVRIALQGHMPYYASIKATYEVLKHLRDGGATADLRDAVASDDLLDIALKRGVLCALAKGLSALAVVCPAHL